MKHLIIPRKVLYRDGEPCNHKGCQNHISHPCEECGRINALGIVYEYPKIGKENDK